MKVLITETGYGKRRLLFWPWHYIWHIRRGVRNGYNKVPYGQGEAGSSWAAPRLFCTWCVDTRLQHTPAPRKVTSAVVQHLQDGGASRDLIDYAKKHITKGES